MGKIAAKVKGEQVACAAASPRVAGRQRGISNQFFDLSTSALAPIHGIIARSLAPVSSIGWR